jgi:hypothetical protein
MSLWEVANSPLTIFLLGSVVVLFFTRYLDARRTKRGEAQDAYPYLVECLNRIDFILSTWPTSERLLVWDIWNINNALAGRQNDTSYNPLFKDLVEQPIEGLLALLEARDPRFFSPLLALRATLERWQEIHQKLELVEFEDLKENAEGFAQFFTGYELSDEGRTEIYQIHLQLTELRREFYSALAAQRRRL